VKLRCALACDPTSFWWSLIANYCCNCNVNCEVVIAKYDKEAITILEKKNRIILIQNEVELPNKQVRTCLNGL
jgi:phosphoribosylaminoimidazolecarboxamide formyltransferase/IMP cyclohydrolase